MKVQKKPIEKNSLMQEILPSNYADAYECIISKQYGISAEYLQIEFWAGRPKWADRLMKLRNMLVRFLGLKTDNILSRNQIQSIIENDTSSKSLKLYKKSDSEIILYKDDKHLRFFFSTQIIILDDDSVKVTASTIVQFHNKMGKLYFFIISPFHRILVKWQFANIIKRVINNH